MTKDVFTSKSLRNPKNFALARTNMLKQQIRTWDVLDQSILTLFDHVHREDYVPSEYKELALSEVSIPIGHGQTLMTPKEEARILQELAIKSKDKVLILGYDSGYLINLSSRLAGVVYYVNDDMESFEHTKDKIASHKLPNVNMMIGSINYGWQQLIPFDVILLTGSLPTVPDELKMALTLNGRLFVVVGNAPIMEATLVTRIFEYTWSERKLFETIRPRLLDVKENEGFKF